jgi:hypothetical protein
MGLLYVSDQELEGAIKGKAAAHRDQDDVDEVAGVVDTAPGAARDQGPHPPSSHLPHGDDVPPEAGAALAAAAAVGAWPSKPLRKQLGVVTSSVEAVLGKIPATLSPNVQHIASVGGELDL